jgi:hypothetical protein
VVMFRIKKFFFFSLIQKRETPNLSWSLGSGQDISALLDVMLVTVRFIGNKTISEKVQNLMFKCVINNRIPIQKIRGRYWCTKNNIMMNNSRVRSTANESKIIQLINYASITYSFFSPRKAIQSLSKYLIQFSKFRWIYQPKFDRFDLGLFPEPMPMVPQNFELNRLTIFELSGWQIDGR